MDRIRITDLEVYAHHGVFEEETRLGQKFYVSCDIYLDALRARMEDDLDASVNYGTVAHLINDSMKEKNFKLIEAAAEYLVEKILLLDEKIQKVELELFKPSAPIGLPIANVSVKVSRARHTAYVALGSNMGDREEILWQAVKRLGEHPLIEVELVSDLIETEPYGYTEQDPFLNGAVELTTMLEPQELLEYLHKLEEEAHRERIIHWGPRTLDLDIIFYDDLVMDTKELTIPHIDMANRRFVLEPLCQIASYYRHPLLKKTIQELLEQI